jgi:hypothetical protein
MAFLAFADAPWRVVQGSRSVTATENLPPPRLYRNNGTVLPAGGSPPPNSRSPPELLLSRVFTHALENAVTRVSAHVLAPEPDAPARDYPTGTGAGPHFSVSLAGKAPTSFEAGIPS